MEILLTITIPIVLLTLQIVFVSLRDKDWSQAICIPLYVGLIIYLYYILHVYWSSGTSPSLTSLPVWVVDFVPVVTYIFVCTRFNVSWFNTTTFMLMAFMLFNLSTGITAYIGDKWGTPPPENGVFYLYFQGKPIFDIDLWQLSMALQFMWICFRFFRYIRKTYDMHLHFSGMSKKLAATMAITLIIGFFTLFIPADIWYATEIPLYVTYGLVSLGTCIMLYMLLRGYALMLVLDRNNEPALFTTHNELENVWRTIQRIMENEKVYLMPNIRIDDLARQVGTNRTYIANAIRSNTGVNFSMYINNLRVAYATEMMINAPEKKMEEIAELCGFSSSSSFTRVYKRQTGKTPKEAKKDGINKQQGSDIKNL